MKTYKVLLTADAREDLKRYLSYLKNVKKVLRVQKMY